MERGLNSSRICLTTWNGTVASAIVSSVWMPRSFEPVGLRAEPAKSLRCSPNSMAAPECNSLSRQTMR
jgi:hypothetical protein